MQVLKVRCDKLHSSFFVAESGAVIEPSSECPDRRKPLSAFYQTRTVEFVIEYKSLLLTFSPFSFSVSFKPTSVLRNYDNDILGWAQHHLQHTV